VAAPAYAGVPVTHRVVSRGAVFVTGHQVQGGLPDLPFEALARSGLTLVFYMGVATLRTIAGRLVDCGMDPSTPAMVVQEGTLPGQRHVAATVGTIADRAAEANIRPPSVTVVGPVVELTGQLATQTSRPLAGKTVVLVRAEERHYPDVERMRTAGARVLDVSGIRCAPLRTSEDVHRMFERIEREHVVVFTSALAARFFAELWPGEPRPRFVAASTAFTSAMERYGMKAEFAPEVTGAGQVLDAMQRNGIEPGTTVWLPRSSAADAELPEAMSAAGYDARPVDLYETLPVPIPADVCSMLAAGRVDAVLFLSGTCVSSVIDAVGDIPASGPDAVTIAAIGPKTAAVARARGLPCHLLPEQPTMKALVDAVIDELSRTFADPNKDR